MIYNTNVPLFYYLVFSGILFSVGLIGLVMRRDNIISMLMAVELMLLSTNINFIAFSVYSGDVLGSVFAFFILCVAAAEVAIGLAILINYFKNRDNIDISKASDLRDL
jgi:NADH-quinone oxidoreductase subunit K